MVDNLHCTLLGYNHIKYTSPHEARFKAFKLSILWYIHGNTPDVGMQIDGRKRILTDLSDQSLNNLSKHSINGTSQQQKCTS